jgi:iron complex outermembrane receptor protein
MALLLAAKASPATAQEGDNAGGIGIEEITVTAQRKATDLQETAAAISAYSAEDLARQGIVTIEDLGILNPSMDVSIYQGEAQVYIRGIGTSGIVGGTDGSSAIHQDGIYLSRAAAAVPAFFDVERIEVVRGPQGTLYGRNATGGSLNVISRRPAEELSAEASALVGNYERYRLFAAISGPLGDPRVLGRLAVQREHRSGYTTAFRPGADPLGLGSDTDHIESREDIAVRAILEFRPSDTVTATIIGDYYEADDTNNVWLLLNQGTGTNPFMRAYLEERGGILPENKSRKLGSDLEHFNRPEIWGQAAKSTGSSAITE